MIFINLEGPDEDPPPNESTSPDVPDPEQATSNKDDVIGDGGHDSDYNVEDDGQKSDHECTPIPNPILKP